jgi:uncharacterized RDD family membrane protein YckC
LKLASDILGKMDSAATFHPTVPVYLVPTHLTLSGVIPRFSAFAIDWLIVLSTDWAVFLTYHIVTQKPLEAWEAAFFQMLYVWIWMGYNVAMISLSGQTFGKKLMRIKVVGEDGSKLTTSQVVVRETIGRFLSTVFFEVGYFWMIFDKNRQTWHDMLAKSIVIKA